MELEDRLTLPPDLVLRPVTQLPASIKLRLNYQRGDYALTRPKARSLSKIVDARTARLLRTFRKPRTIVEAVLEYSRATRTQPRQTLREAFPVIQRFLDSKLLVLAGSEASAVIRPSFRSGDRVCEYRVLSNIQVLADMELYRVTSTSGVDLALKFLRPGWSTESRRALKSEEAILARLSGSVSPALLKSGCIERRPYLAMEWIDGVNVAKAASDMRAATGNDQRTHLHSLCSNILGAYIQLHEQRVIHGDVHPRNILATPAGHITIIDYGLGRVEGTRGFRRSTHRGGVGFYYEPEFAEARRDHTRPPLCSALGEQYALGALIYFLLTGAHYLEFSLEEREMLLQVISDPPLPFSRRGLKPSPAVEAVLGRALSKRPDQRFSSLAEFKLRYDEATLEDKQCYSSANARRRSGVDLIQSFLSKTMAELARPDLLPSKSCPTGSVNYGASGIAYAICRIAGHTDDPTLLSLSDVWISRAESDIGDDKAYYHTGIGVTAEVVGRVSPYHTRTGVHAVRALISQAMGDIVSRNEAVAAFVDSSSKSCTNVDLVLGRSGTLLVSAMLIEAISEYEEPANSRLLTFGDVTMTTILRKINAWPSIRECYTFPYLGIAHGWAGVLYALMRWCRARHRPMPAGVEARLEQLSQLAVRDSLGIRWQKKIRPSGVVSQKDYLSGWCNGSTGFIHLWTLANEVLPNRRFLELAESCGTAVWKASNNSALDLCCGLSGQAYGFLNLYKHTGERTWLDRAGKLAATAVVAADALSFHGSLYKGRVGLTLLAAELSQPEKSSMPFFEHEGWPN